MRITDVEATAVSVPYSVPTTWSKGRGVRTFNLIIKVSTDEGLVGWGESVGPAVYNAKNLVEREFRRLLIGADPCNHAAIRASVDLALDYLPGARWAFSGVDMALWDLRGKASGSTVSDLLGGRLAEEVECVGYVFIDAADVNAAEARRFVAAGHRTIKMKVGRDFRIDEARIAAVRDAIGPDVQLRIDPNAAWTRYNAAAFLRVLEQYDLEFVEQPLPRGDLEGHAELRRRSNVPIAVDESCGTLQDAIRLASSGACDVFVVYVSQAGGLMEAKRIADFAADVGLRCVMGSASELAVATVAQAHVVVSSAGFRGAMDTHIPLQDGDVVTAEHAVVLREGSVVLPQEPGLGADVDEDALPRYPVPDIVPTYSLYDA